MPGNPSPIVDASNRTDANPVGCWLVPLIFVVMVAVGWGWWSSQPDIITTSWANYEPVFQDNLANKIRKGLMLDFANDTWSEKFNQLNSNVQFGWIFTYDGEGVTAAHFPGVPYLMAAGEMALSDREVFVIGFAGLLLALALALLVNAIRLQFGWWVGLIAALALIGDGLIFQAVRFQSGDTLVAALIVLAFLAFTHGVSAARRGKRSIWTWPFAGALLGATTLFQAATCFWLILLLTVWLGYSAFHWFRQKNWGLPAEAFALFWIGVFVVAAPWWIRNCQVTGQFKPLGHSVGMNLAGAYCDESLLAGGNLKVDKIVKLRERELIAFEFQEIELVEKEAHLDKFGVATARQWIGEHPSDIPRLILGRVTNHLGLHSYQSFDRVAFNALMLVGGLIGCLLSWRRWGGIIFVLVGVSTIVTAATWSDFGRQLIPLRALIDVAFAIGIAKLLRAIERRRRSKIAQPSSGT